MNAVIDNLQQAQQSLVTDFQQRIAALQTAQEAAQAAIDAHAQLEIAQQEQEQARLAKATALDALNLGMTPVLDALQSTNSEVEAMRKTVAHAHQQLAAMANVQASLIGRFGMIAVEIARVAAANPGAFANKQEMRDWVASKILHLIPSGVTSIGELPFKQVQLYNYRSFGTNDQQRIINDALSRLR